MSNSKTDILVGLDLLRFFLAIAVLIVHFPHFNFPFSGNADYFTIKDLPFFYGLNFIYHYGGIGVQVFWMISGVVFYQIYHEHILKKQISFRKFIYLRFTRLYPLHFIMLLSVALLQHFYFQQNGTHYNYNNNDVVHFILNLFTINFWSSKFGFSFNWPFWSVSVEIFVYLVFFILSSSGLIKGLKTLIAFVAIFMCFYGLAILSPFYECLLYFFSGCLLTFIFKMPLKKISALAGLMVFLEVILLNVRPYRFEVDRVVICLIRLNFSFLIVGLFMFIFKNATDRCKYFLRNIGSLTYSTYMVHISIQIILVLLFKHYGRQFYFNTLFFISYLVICCTLGWLVFIGYEQPMQNLLRKLSRKYQF